MTIIHVWILVSFIGLCLSIYLTWDSYEDLRSLGPEGNGRRTAAGSRVLREGIRITVHFAYLVVALPLVGHAQDVRVNFTVGVLLYGNIALVINSLIDARARSLMYPHRKK